MACWAKESAIARGRAAENMGVQMVHSGVFLYVLFFKVDDFNIICNITAITKCRKLGISH